MAIKWEVGDRFIIEGVVLEVAPGDSFDCWVKIDGEDFRTYIKSEAMAKARRSIRLNLEKRIRVKSTGERVQYVLCDNDHVVVYDEAGCLRMYRWEQLENVLDSCREAISSVSVYDSCGLTIGLGNVSGALSRAKVSYREGEGWNIEEIL